MNWVYVSKETVWVALVRKWNIKIWLNYHKTYYDSEDKYCTGLFSKWKSPSTKVLFRITPTQKSCSTYIWNNLKKKLTWWGASAWNVSFSIHLWVTVAHKCCTVLYYCYFALLMWTFGADPYVYISKVKKIDVLFLILLIYLCISKGGRYPNREIIQDLFFVGIRQWCWNSCQWVAV